MLENREGQRVPNVTFHLRANDAWQLVTTEDLFHGKTVIVFSLPGAFTPTCSATHLPRFSQLASAFKANGVDDIICISVNDAFVMNEWKKNQAADDITLIADGNAEFTEGMGMLVDKRDIGLGKRSWRYSMLVKDGLIEKMFIEPQKPGDPFEVSDADTMFAYLAPEARKPAKIALLTKPGCPFCKRAKDLLHEHGLAYSEVPLEDRVRLAVVSAITGATSTPQMFVDGKLIGGSEAIAQWLGQTELKAA
ncbi:MAG: glutathione peroxidase [Betaproteobacteria bacterium]|nr:MAG: glutathione peroxidase [Betaproteobacteria bacterium]